MSQDMEKIEIVDLDQKRFDVLVGPAISPLAGYIGEELAWFSNKQETVIGAVVRDRFDDDYGAVIFGRDEGRRFRGFDFVTSLPSFQEANDWAKRTILWQTGLGNTVFPQGDKHEGLDLLTPIRPLEELHPYFVHLIRSRMSKPARAVIGELMSHFRDIDGNFVEQFQTTGFDSRLWELYLDCYFREEALLVTRDHYAPDFIVRGADGLVAIEAVTVGRKEDQKPRYLQTTRESPKIAKEHDSREAMPIRFGSVLYSKLQKRYWDLPHVKDIPLVFAIADFHADLSMQWSSTSLIEYLYGFRHEHHHDPEGNLVITPVEIGFHQVGEKKIPSGFFNQPDAENVSAVLFSASGTCSKFSRVGIQAGFGDPGITVIRRGTCHDHDPNAVSPKLFQYVVSPESEELWAEGLSMFHNPNAAKPISMDMFPSIAHHHCAEGQVKSWLPEFHPYASLTNHFVLRPNE